MQTTLHGVLSKMTQNANESNFSHTCALLTCMLVTKVQKLRGENPNKQGLKDRELDHLDKKALALVFPKLDTLRSR